MRGFFKGRSDTPSRDEPTPPRPQTEVDPPSTPEDEEYLSQLARSVLHRPASPPPASAPADPKGPPTDWKEAHSLTPLPVAIPRNTPRPAKTPRPTATPRPTNGTPAPEADPDSQSIPTISAASLPGTFAPGTILYFEDKSIGVYKDRRAGKDYEVVLILRPDGIVESQGIALESYDVRVIGTLPPDFLLRLQRRERWERDEIIFHLKAFDFCALVPHPVKTASPTAKAESPRTITRPATHGGEVKRLVPGVHFMINFGPQQAWQAIYWGEDDLGPVVAHQTHDKWALMHLDLNRFRDSLIIGDPADAALLQRIREEIAHK